MTTGSSQKSDTATTGLLVAVTLLVIVVLGLGGAIVALQLRPEPAPETSAGRDLMLWEQMANENPDEAWAMTGLGLAQLAAGQEEAAKTSFEAAISMNPEEWSAMLELGKMSMANEPLAAAEFLSDAGDLAPRNEKAPIYIALGDLLLANGDPAGARTAYETSISDLPFIFDSQFGLAVALEELGETDDAIAQYRRAQDFDPTNPAVLDALTRLGAATQTGTP